MSGFDLTGTLRALAGRNPGRSEADIQALVREVLVHGGFDLGEEMVALEAPAEDRKRLDVAVGALIIECKRDLRAPGQLTRAETQLGGYLKAKAATAGRYNGVLTDGAIWRLYRHGAAGLTLVNELTLHPARIDERAFRWWLGGTLATERSIEPTAAAIAQRLGAGAPSFALARVALLDCWRPAKSTPAVMVKRDLWAKLLRSALGSQFEGTDELFVEHTYLVLLAVLIGHAVMGEGPDKHLQNPGVLLSGQLFERAGLLGVGEAGFFDWVLDTGEGAEVVSDIARRVASFEWESVDHDVLKALYHSVIAPQVRKRLGEYYTPDWLASRIVHEVVDDPLDQRVLDPACGSGTFLFHAVRRHLAAAAGDGIPVGEAVTQVTNSVFGVDLHPVAVVLAQTTYLLAIGRQRLDQRAQTLSIPVYLGDSMRWEVSDADIFTAAGDIRLSTAGDTQLFATDLHFPAALVADVGRFDHLVNELVDRASTRRQPGGPRGRIDGLLNAHAVPDTDRPAIKATYEVLCDLHDEGRNHIWGFYIRNQSRPAWLSRLENRVDVLVGNPPWLAYRYMPAPLQKLFEQRGRARHLWMGGARGRSTQQDLSGYFVARSIELYLRDGGRFGFVMPRAVLSRQTYGGFRAGNYSSIETCCAAFSTAWDLERVRPEPFPVPAAVAFGTRSAEPKPLPASVLAWSGGAPTHGTGGSFETTPTTITAVTGQETASTYRERFRQGAILVPRFLTMVVSTPASPLGVPQGRRDVRSRKTSLDKPPWRDVPALTGVIESIFIRPAYLGESIAPFRILSVPETIIPYDGTRLMTGEDDRIDRYPGLADWWRTAEDIYLQHRPSGKRTLDEQLDYMHQLSAQFPVAPWRVVYTASGNTLAAAIVGDTAGVVEHKLYWAPVATRKEAQYLVAVLNAPVLGALVRPYQSVGAFGPRDFDKYVWRAPIPAYNPGNSLHRRLSDLAAEAESAADSVDVHGQRSFKGVRRVIRDELAGSGIAAALDRAVEELIKPRTREG